MNIVLNPDFVVVQRAAKPDVLTKVAAVGIRGGVRFQAKDSERYAPGQPFGKTFSFGYMSPEQIVVVMKSGKRAQLSGARQILFCGGAENGPGADKILQQLLAQPSPLPGVNAGPYSSEIVDPRDTFTDVIDNGASQQIVDRGGDDTSDFADLIRKRNAAMVENNGDDLAALASLQEGVQADLKAEAPFSRTNPVSISGGQLGGVVTVDNTAMPSLTLTGAPCTNLVEVARWAGNDAETTPVTITLFVTQASQNPSLSGVSVDATMTPLDVTSSRPFAQIKFGTKGYLTTVEVDIGTGTQLTVPASFVSVSVGIDGSIPTDDARPVGNISLDLNGMISFGATNKFAPLTRTACFGIIDAATPNSLYGCFVPPYAKRVFVERGLDSVPVSIGFAGYDQTVGGTIVIPFIYRQAIAANALMSSPVLLPTDARLVYVRNDNAAGGVDLEVARIIFEIEL